ncbi:rhodanese-related sulfurtransferase [Shewanella psychrophila]|uniref:Rhodanese-related sulfurtransferase n=1 Tax=Shewanella psychrophila TaxID=225848 RepID=A0A1S6HM14_9GAMM|nr:sulfurtransferase [Shewanella psychrophila]AQS36560.1 rhodanese-related sulfurtransferase [Shewanella psychrophila]
MKQCTNPPLVTTQWLEQNLDNDKLILLDASMEKVVGKSPIIYDTFSCIPGAKKLDLENELCDLTSNQTHAFPTAQQFIEITSGLGISQESLVVIYDNQGIYSSPRAWWIFKVMGFINVYVLNGGLPQWLAEGRATAHRFSPSDRADSTLADSVINSVINRPCQLRLEVQDTWVCESSYLLDKLSDKQVSIFDARGAARFSGTAPEPREGVRSGHIPNSVNLPFSQVLDGHCLKSTEELQRVFTGLANEQDIQRIFSCGSGITACILILASVEAGYQRNVLYDGSWAEWGSDSKLPIE